MLTSYKAKKFLKFGDRKNELDHIISTGVIRDYSNSNNVARNEI